MEDEIKKTPLRSCKINITPPWGWGNVENTQKKTPL